MKCSIGRISTSENPATFAYFLKVEGVIAAPLATELGYSKDCGRQSNTLNCNRASLQNHFSLPICLSSLHRQLKLHHFRIPYLSSFLKHYLDWPYHEQVQTSLPTPPRP